jgi:hypothetical protein
LENLSVELHRRSSQTIEEKGMNEAALTQYPHAGSVFRVKIDAIGMKNFEFVAG